MLEVINAPQKNICVRLVGHVKVLPVDHENGGVSIAVAMGELIVIGKRFEFRVTDPPCFHRRDTVSITELSEGQSV
jgi:hypothetical protein